MVTLQKEELVAHDKKGFQIENTLKPLKYVRSKLMKQDSPTLTHRAACHGVCAGCGTA
ncbi:hypothetical protein [Comamonas sp. CAH-2]|jgi:hypothetical protein|uniref:hypothetical protein n=1 Tax=Comamonas sp. CAH-2 TaxID=2605745 RepID=UPI0012AD5DD1|nr:hypothetical protein [Comamonas sp. CAH-2]